MPGEIRPAYAGIGARLTPADVLARVRLIACDLEARGYVLRSGAAAGADTHFEIGVRDQANLEIHLPWKGFRGHWSRHCAVCPAALALAARYHPNWQACSLPARLLHARNCYQILGRDLNTPAAFVVCWTPGGAVVGGTGQALRIAIANGVPVFNLADATAETQLMETVMRG